ncbi:hypothetical protein ABKN59_001012 [Abortiporus biennis]
MRCFRPHTILAIVYNEGMQSTLKPSSPRQLTATSNVIPITTVAQRGFFQCAHFLPIFYGNLSQDTPNFSRLRISSSILLGERGVIIPISGSGQGPTLTGRLHSTDSLTFPPHPTSTDIYRLLLPIIWDQDGV